MKIGFDDIPAAPAGTYSQHLARLLAEYAPEHEYIIDGKRSKEFDLYHGFRTGLPFPVLLRRIPCVMTVHNLNFLRYPHLYSLGERLVLLRLYRRMLRSAERLITVNRDAREELSDRLRIDPGKIEVVMPLAARVPQEPPADAELESVRRKYALPRDFVLMLGTVEPRHNHEVLFEALAQLRERECERLEMKRRDDSAGLGAAAERSAEQGAQPAAEQGAESAAAADAEQGAGRYAASVAAAVESAAERSAESRRETDGVEDLNPENAGWRDGMAAEGGGRGDVEAGAAAHGGGAESPDVNRNTVADSAVPDRDRIYPAAGETRRRDGAQIRNAGGGAGAGAAGHAGGAGADGPETASGDTGSGGAGVQPGETPAPRRIGIVVCGRRTAYADFLLGYARQRHMAARVDFIYELSPEDLPALFRLARTFVYLPDAEIEASIVPVVEALRAGLPMILSDTRLNREAAADAAVYVNPEAVGEVAAALENVLWDETFRSEMRLRERRRAELFSEYAVAKRLTDIYTSL